MLKLSFFAETKKKVDSYSKYIRDMGFHCLSIHGDKKQQEREWVLGEFKKKPRTILCATDVAARGINIADIKYVINIDYPMATEDYIHRIGRTARSSNTGTAFTFITRENSRHIPQLINVLKEANQFVSEQLQSLCRGGFRNGSGRGGYQRYGSSQNTRGGYAGNDRNQQSNGYGNNQNGSSQDNYPRKREASTNDMNGNGEAKRKRWDDGGSSHGPSSHMSGGMRPSNGSSYGQNNRQNGHSNGKSAYGPPPPSTNGHSAPPQSLPPPPPPSNGHHHAAPPPSSTNGTGPHPVPTAAYGYPADYTQMYNLQYYQAMAAAAHTGQPWNGTAAPPPAATASYPPAPPPVKAP